MITYGVYPPTYFIARKALFYIFVCYFTIPSFISTLLLSEMYVTHESCNCVLNFVLGQPDKVRNGPSNVTKFHHYG